MLHPVNNIILLHPVNNIIICKNIFPLRISFHICNYMCATYDVFPLVKNSDTGPLVAQGNPTLRRATYFTTLLLNIVRYYGCKAIDLD